MDRRLTALLLAPLAIGMAVHPGRARAEPAPRAREGVVVALDSGDLVVDLGTLKGAFDGEVVELWRPVRLKHPVTGATLTDRFRIGAVRLTQVQGTLSLARLEGQPLRPVTAGDVVVMPPAEPQPAQAAAPAETPYDATPADPDAAPVTRLLETLAGAPPEARIAAYETFVRAHPKSRYASVLNEEAAALRAANAPRRVVAAPAEAPYDYAERPVERARPGLPQRVAIELDPRLVGAVLHARKKGAPGYRSMAMESLGPRYWSAVLPGDVVAEPGLEYFVEGVPSNGRPVAIVGTAAQPRDVAVDPAPIQGKGGTTLAQASIQSELASFNAKRANDYVWQTEAALGWRLRDTGLRAIRSGFGVIRGKGGSLDELDRLGAEPRDIGLSYGWLECEVTLSPTLAVIGRPILGLRQGGITSGAQGFVRVGRDLATNLLVGGEALGSVGTRGIVELDWRTIPRVPIVLRTEVTTQPAGIGGDIGARAIAQVGYELARDFVVAVRGSYQGRTIDHSGPGAGLAVSYQW